MRSSHYDQTRDNLENKNAFDTEDVDKAEMKSNGSEENVQLKPIM